MFPMTDEPFTAHGQSDFCAHSTSLGSGGDVPTHWHSTALACLRAQSGNIGYSVHGGTDPQREGRRSAHGGIKVLKSQILLS